MSELTRPLLLNDLVEGAFAGPIAGSLTPRRIGAEVEFIPVESLTGRRCIIEGDGVAATLPFLRRFGEAEGWREGRTPKGTPCFSLPSGGTLTFEPGGQIEYSSPPCRSASGLLRLLRRVVLPLRAAAAGEGIELLALGIDPLNPIDGRSAADQRQALSTHGGVPRQPGSGRRPHDAANRVPAGEPRFR